MTSNKGTKKKVKKSPSNGRRLKNSREIRLDVEGVQGALWKLFRTSRKWSEEAADCEFIYKRISSGLYDDMRETIDQAFWAKQTMGKQYVAENLQGCFDTTSYQGLYKSKAGG